MPDRAGKYLQTVHWLVESREVADWNQEGGGQDWQSIHKPNPLLFLRFERLAQDFLACTGYFAGANQSNPIVQAGAPHPKVTSSLFFPSATPQSPTSPMLVVTGTPVKSHEQR